MERKVKVVMKKSRTEYSTRNTTIAIFARISAILAGFATRVVFTHTLSQDYVGINGLFSDILNVLALSELGAGTAITYALYQPVAQENTEKQKSLMRMFRDFYRIVAAFVTVGGLLVIPFMDKLIKDQTEIEHLILIYLLYLFDSVLSYLMVYKRTLMDAHQLSYIGVLYHTIALLLQNVLQIFILTVTGNFILYALAAILCTFLNNVAISKKADQMYPYLREKAVQQLPKQEKKAIYRNIRAMLMHKLGTVIVNNTDNLLLSSLVGIISNSIYSNYYLVIGSIRQVLNQMFQGIAASVGNLGVEEDPKRIKKIFEASFFIGQWVFGMAAICIFEVIDIFAGFCFGGNYVFPRDITFILCLNFYLTGMRQASIVFRESLGIFWYDRYKSLAEAAINLSVSIFLGIRMGTAGIFWGTAVSTIAVPLWIEPYILYRHCLKSSSAAYFLHYGLYASVTFILWLWVDFLCQKVCGGPWMIFTGRLSISLIITNLAYLVIYHRMKEFQLLVEKGKNILIQKYQKIFKKEV